jgi:hypothetical protein
MSSAQEAFRTIATWSGFPEDDETAMRTLGALAGFLASAKKNHDNAEMVIEVTGGRIIGYSYRDRATGKLLGSGTFRSDGTVEQF